MRAVILCAGYATRLYPLTLDFPKPLLPVAGKPLLNYIIENMEKIAALRDITLITNAKFRKHFDEWSGRNRFSKGVKVLNDTSMSPDDRLGAIRDLYLAVQEAGIDEDLLVVAGDNLFDFSIGDFVKFAQSKSPAITLASVDIGARELARQYGVLQCESDGRVSNFLEKPKDPPSTLVSMGLYFFPKAKLGRIPEFLENLENPDAPGFFMKWLIGRETLYCFSFKGLWYDIGDLQSYENAQKLFK